MEILLYALGFYGLYYLLRYGLTAFNIWSIPFEPIRFTLKESLPEVFAPFFARPIAQLEALGFTSPQAVWVTSISGLPGWGILMPHETAVAYALIELKTGLDSIAPHEVTFYTLLTSGQFVFTWNGVQHLVLGEMVKTVVQDHYTADTAQQWAWHQQLVAQQTETAVSLPPLDFITQLQTHYQTYFDHLIATGLLLIANTPGKWHPSWRGAWGSTVKLFRGTRRATALRKALLAQQQATNTPQPDVPVALETASYHSLQKMHRRQLSRQGKGWLILVTMILFVLSFAWLLGFEFLLVLLGVILLHEGGHWLAMRLTGYENMSFFFIPFFGAAVVGVKQQAEIWEQVIVLLAGPLPGLTLGIGLTWLLADTAVPYWLNFTAIMLIILNLLNLLPLFPLDGGQIVNLLLFARRPYADVIFKIIAVTVFGLAAIRLQEWILLLLGLIVAASIRSSFRLATIFKHIPLLDLTQADEDGRIQASFQAIRDAGYSQLPFNYKYQIVRGLLNRSWKSSVNRWSNFAWTITYLVILSGALFLSITLLRP